MIQTIDYQQQQSDHRKQPYCLFTLLFLTFSCAQKREQAFLSLFVYVLYIVLEFIVLLCLIQELNRAHAYVEQTPVPIYTLVYGFTCHFHINIKCSACLVRIPGRSKVSYLLSSGFPRVCNAGNSYLAISELFSECSISY